MTLTPTERLLRLAAEMLRRAGETADSAAERHRADADTLLRAAAIMLAEQPDDREPADDPEPPTKLRNKLAWSWTAEEDNALAAAWERGLQRTEIQASVLPHRTQEAISARVNVLRNRGDSRFPTRQISPVDIKWRAEEDDELLRQHRAGVRFRDLALDGRTNEACRTRLKMICRRQDPQPAAAETD